jgi:plastocyanin
MRRLFVVVVSAAALGSAGPAAAATVTVRIVKSGFTPVSVTVNADDTVTWANRDTVNHQVIAVNGSFASPVIAPGKTWSYTFRGSGSFGYRDALEPSERGSVVVRARPAAVTLGADPAVLTFGTEAHLRGTISSGRAGETVALFQWPYGQASPVQLTVAITTTGGAYDVIVKPQILTGYFARYRTSQSAPVGIQIRPRITFVPRGRHTMYTRVGAGRSFAGRSVYLQRRTQFGQWVTVRKLKLGPNSGRIFRVAPRTRTRYRIFITVNQAGVGYLASWSGTQTVRGLRR